MKTESMKDSHNEAEEGNVAFDFIVHFDNSVIIIIWSIFLLSIHVQHIVLSF